MTAPAADELAPLLRTNGRGVTLPCRVQTRASCCRIAGIADGALKIALTSPPLDGRANAELCAFLAKKTGMPKSSVRVMLGETSRSKVILFASASPASVLEGLCR